MLEIVGIEVVADVAAVLTYAKQEIEDALTTEVAELLRRHVEEPLGMTLKLLGAPADRRDPLSIADSVATLIPVGTARSSQVPHSRAR